MIREITAVVWTGGPPASWLPTITRLLEVSDISDVVVATNDDLGLPEHPRLRTVLAPSFGAVVHEVASAGANPLLVVTGPVLVPRDGFVTSREIMSGDLRVASVSFLCNAAGHLSFPHRNLARRHAIEGHDETSLTRLLRTRDPAVRPAPIHAVAGPATLVSRDTVMITGGPSAAFADDPELALVEMMLRASRRGMRSMLDPSTFVSRPWEDQRWGEAPLQVRPNVRRLRELHPFFPELFRDQMRDSTSPLALVLGTAAAKANGLRIVIDATCLGPVENGTQVQTLALIDALARRDDVNWVGAGLGGPIPRYAEKVLSHPKVKVLATDGLRFPPKTPRADVVHRPFQPGKVPWANWRGVGDRVVVTIQDLIAYSIGAYAAERGKWLGYRDNIRDGVAYADGVVVISHDVAEDLRQERLPIVDERLFVVENGTDHLTGDEEESFPSELAARGWVARRFLVVLGANYSHKNRDLAIRTHKLLQERHPDLGLVLAGVAVPEGSSRVLEAAEGFGSDGIITIPDVTSEERNWLLRHAEICLYPTSAEGFGLVPFEAARFGTPTVYTRFGPLAEVLPGLPVASTSWDPAALATACDELLTSPDLAAEQVAATLKAGTTYRWEATAEHLVHAYRRLLSEPPRVEPPRKRPSPDRSAGAKIAGKKIRNKE
ncbi:glycosyltransferase [Nocardioides sp. LHD-245]|uniref:glycosyltransferase n=1 Tax=Nocardioides sp. LHD-245 TaxID=3051387 RepID=UPI0027DFF74E|nr:glycosyltransferase [Nocardioides sp. LHD-245]